MTKFKINELRGIACLLVVMFHAVGNTAQKGMHLPDGAFLRQMVDAFAFVRMPLFAIISGYVYARHPVNDWREFGSRKVTRLVQPLIGCTLIYWSLGHDGTPLWKALAANYAHLWYLQATIVILLLVVFFDNAFNCSLRGRFMAFALGMLLPTFEWASMSGVHYLLPFFFLGMMVYGKEEWVLKMAPLAIPVAIAVWVLTWVIPLDRAAIGLGSVAAFIALAAIVPDSDFLRFIGRHSYFIYLWHVLAMALPRAVLHYAQVDSDIIMLISRMTAGVVLPITMWKVGGSLPFAGWLFGSVRKDQQVQLVHS